MNIIDTVYGSNNKWVVGEVSSVNTAGKMEAFNEYKQNKYSGREGSNEPTVLQIDKNKTSHKKINKIKWKLKNWLSSKYFCN